MEHLFAIAMHRDLLQDQALSKMIQLILLGKLTAEAVEDVHRNVGCKSTSLMRHVELEALQNALIAAIIETWESIMGNTKHASLSKVHLELEFLVCGMLAALHSELPDWSLPIEQVNLAGKHLMRSIEKAYDLPLSQILDVLFQLPVKA